MDGLETDGQETDEETEEWLSANNNKNFDSLVDALELEGNDEKREEKEIEKQPMMVSELGEHKKKETVEEIIADLIKKINFSKLGKALEGSAYNIDDCYVWGRREFPNFYQILLAPELQIDYDIIRNNSMARTYCTFVGVRCKYCDKVVLFEPSTVCIESNKFTEMLFTLHKQVCTNKPVDDSDFVEIVDVNKQDIIKQAKKEAIEHVKLREEYENQIAQLEAKIKEMRIEQKESSILNSKQPIKGQEIVKFLSITKKINILFFNKSSQFFWNFC